jgi:hypothetical protein
MSEPDMSAIKNHVEEAFKYVLIDIQDIYPVCSQQAADLGNDAYPVFTDDCQYYTHRIFILSLCTIRLFKLNNRIIIRIARLNSTFSGKYRNRRVQPCQATGNSRLDCFFIRQSL